MAMHFIRRILGIAALAAGLLAGGSDAGVAQAARPEVDQYVQGQLIEQRISGAALVVLRDGAVIYAKAYGKPFPNVRRDRLFAPPSLPAVPATYLRHELTVMAFTSLDAPHANPGRIVRAVSPMFAPAL